MIVAPAKPRLGDAGGLDLPTEAAGARSTTRSADRRPAG
jgi:hypothetical protein